MGLICPLAVKEGKMKVEYRKNSINHIPENDQDEVYLESVLDLHKKGDTAIAERVAPMGLDHAWAYLKIRRGGEDGDKRD